jgi:hypothetical protein
LDRIDIQVDFPIEGLDMAPYLAPAAVSQYMSSEAAEAEAGAGADTSDRVASETEGSESEGAAAGKEVADLQIVEEQEELEDEIRRGGASPLSRPSHIIAAHKMDESSQQVGNSLNFYTQLFTE